jgi:hypothetical protein
VTVRQLETFAPPVNLSGDRGGCTRWSHGSPTRLYTERRPALQLLRSNLGDLDDLRQIFVDRGAVSRAGAVVAGLERGSLRS